MAQISCFTACGLVALCLACTQRANPDRVIGATAGDSSTTSGGDTTGGLAADGGPACGAGEVWQGEICLVTSCSPPVFGRTCRIADGGLGRCFDTDCLPPGYSIYPTGCDAIGTSCPEGTVCRDGGCVDANGAPAPCSDQECPPGKACSQAGSFCAWISCDGGRDNEPCVTGMCCASTCEDQQDFAVQSVNDSLNCGACGLACGEDQVCAGGLCRQAYACDAQHDGYPCLTGVDGGGNCCHGTCVSFLWDNSSCNGCGFACGSAQSCVRAQCIPQGCVDAECPVGTRCGAQNMPCVPSSCGSNTLNDTCVGTYVDGGGYVGLCCGDSDCTDIANSPLDCGLCGVSCAAGTFCSGGLCTPTPDCLSASPGLPCPAPGGGVGECCGGTCVSRYKDSSNCDSCGSKCGIDSACYAPWGPNDEVYCAGPLCSDAGCADPGDDCLFNFCTPTDCTGLPDSTICSPGAGSDGFCCGGVCVQQDDPSNCGGCGFGCATGAQCAYGSCSIACGSGATCPAGSACASGACITPTCTGKMEGNPCVSGPGTVGLCCGGQCIDPAQDQANCGACGAQCDGDCTPDGCFPSHVPCYASCPPGQLCYLDGCFIGDCGLPQQAGAPWPLCSTVSGALGFCCADQSCADLGSDPGNCGICGSRCPEDKSCINGSCQGVTLPCGRGRIGQYCDPDATSDRSKLCCASGCVDVTTDSANCGGCELACEAGATCVNGACSGG